MINIRPATLLDIPAIEAIYRELFATMADLQPDYYLNASQNREFIEGLINVQETGLFFAEKEGNPLGF